MFHFLRRTRAVVLWQTSRNGCSAVWMVWVEVNISRAALKWCSATATGKNHAWSRSSLLLLDLSPALNSDSTLHSQWFRLFICDTAAVPQLSLARSFSPSVIWLLFSPHLLSLVWEGYPGLDCSPVLPFVVKPWHISGIRQLDCTSYLDSP